MMLFATRFAFPAAATTADISISSISTVSNGRSTINFVYAEPLAEKLLVSNASSEIQTLSVVCAALP